VLKQGQDTTAAEIQRFVAKVANNKQIRKATFIDAIPKSASGKILRRVIRQQATK
jgi:acyl-coenzyme A synthetase/AMP-(fatty) acid ligase